MRLIRPTTAADHQSLRLMVRATFWTFAVLALPACLLTTAAHFASSPALLAQLSPFRVQYALLLAAFAAFCLLLRRPRWAACFTAFAAFNTAVVLQALRPFSPAPAAPSATGSPAPLKILLANVLTSNPDPAPLLALIAAERPDIVALLEINDRWKRQLAPTLGLAYPQTFFRPREDNFGLAVFSRLPTTGGNIEFFADVETPSFDFSVIHQGRPIRVLVTHPLPPGDTASAALRDAHLGDLLNWAAFVAGLPAASSTPPPAGAPVAPVVILGDLNATPWCPPLRRLLSEGRLHLAARGHVTFAPTWPSTIPFLLIPLDHALLSASLICTAYRVGPDIGSDHHPLLLEVHFAP